jgi:UDP-N-acetylmuramoyl-L-alanyl-D-glutamate--2,6-diaminopimelate ligase
MNVEAPPTWRPLKALLGGLVDVPERLEVSDITQDSRSVTPGAAFLACQGRTHHGLEFAHSAVAAGARAILWEPAPGVTPPPLDAAIVVCAVPNLSAQLGFIADRFFDAPSASLTVAGITGTNGKTTCAWLLAQALQFCGRRSAYIGTLGAGMPGALKTLAHTTPDALTLHRLLAGLRSSGFDSVAMEVSSHALDQDRCAGVRFHTAVFTNLTRDHLDFHKTMEEYSAAKRLLFSPDEGPAPQWAILNADDPASESMLPPGEARVIWYGMADTADLRAENIRSGFDGLRFDVVYQGQRQAIESSFVGHINVSNILAAMGVGLSYGMDLAAIADGIRMCPPVPGRFERVEGGQPFLVVVDYAHTDDALRNVLQVSRELAGDGRVITLFGCGGDRDRSKRPLMGMAAAEASDFVVLTSDNPRSEDPLDIMNDVMVGLGRFDTPHVTQPDRAKAIAIALGEAKAGDVVLLAGKGHETYQILKNRTIDFDDRETARQVLQSLGYKKHGI